jgi:hypothetical protein
MKTFKQFLEIISEKNVPTSPEKWARAKAAAKSKFAVYPSAYANGWASKKYKAMGGGWKSVNEEVDITEKNDSHTHAAHYEDPKTGEWTGMNLLIAKDDDDAIRQANEKCKEGCRLTKVERHITVKEEVEQIDELKKSTVFSWLKQQPVVPEKKPGMSRKDHNKKIKTSSKSWNRALDRLAGYKPTSEMKNEEVEYLFDIIEEMVEAAASEYNIDSELLWDRLESVSDEDLIEESAAWQRKAGKDPKGGLNRKGIASYRRENPGSKLSMAVTTPPSKLKPGSKAANRRKSFCARMGGMQGAMKKPNGEPTRKALALRKWNC